MSWWIVLEDKKGNIIDTDTIRQEGGTQVMGGISEAELNVTYNYGKHFSFGELDSMSAEDAAPKIKAAVNKLGNDTKEDYWEPTEGNVKIALQTLLEFAEYAITNGISAKFNVD